MMENIGISSSRGVYFCRGILQQKQSAEYVENKQIRRMCVESVHLRLTKKPFNNWLIARAKQGIRELIGIKNPKPDSALVLKKVLESRISNQDLFRFCSIMFLVEISTQPAHFQLAWTVTAEYMKCFFLPRRRGNQQKHSSQVGSPHKHIRKLLLDYTKYIKIPFQIWMLKASKKQFLRTSLLRKSMGTLFPKDWCGDIWNRFHMCKGAG